MALSIVEFGLNKASKQPIFTIKTDIRYITCLFNTKGSLPIWCRSVESLKVTFPNVRRSKSSLTAIVPDFVDNENILSEIWEIPNLVFQDRYSKNTLTIRKVLIAVFQKDYFKFNMILSPSMFDKIDCTSVDL